MELDSVGRFSVFTYSNNLYFRAEVDSDNWMQLYRRGDTGNAYLNFCMGGTSHNYEVPEV